MANARDIVEQYFAAFWAEDSQTARDYLADDLSFSGPAAAFTGADVYLQATAHVRRGVHGLQTHKIFADGPDVCIFYSLQMDGPLRSAAVAEWYHVDGTTISSIRTILDTAPFMASARQQPRQQPAETALDPVCQMTVEKASAPATRRYEGTTYFFCNPGCAEAFEKEPETYLAASR
jgi:YHS domain-containing protein